LTDGLDDAKTVQLRYLDIEYNEVGILFLDELNGLPAVVRFPDDVNVFFLSQEVPDF